MAKQITDETKLQEIADRGSVVLRVVLKLLEDEDNDVVFNTLVHALAIEALDRQVPKEEFMKVITEHLGVAYDGLAEDVTH